MILLSGGQGQNIQQQSKLRQYLVLAEKNEKIYVSATKKKSWRKKEKHGKKGIEGLPLDQMVIQCRQEADRDA